jgi:hypothetical protein
MLLPNALVATIPRPKLHDYVLDEAHTDNQGKAALFRALGYSQANWEQFAEDIRAQHLTQDAIYEGPGRWGEMWRIEAVLSGPFGSARIRTVWIIPFGTDQPRFVTAYGRIR